MATETLSIAITAELGQLTSALKEASDLGDAEIRDMVKGIQRSLKQAENAAKKAGDKTKAIGDAAKNAQEAAKKAGALMGGAFGKAGEVIFELVPKIQGAAAGMGALGVAAGGAAAAVAAVGVAFVASLEQAQRAADTGVEAAKSLREAWKAAAPETEFARLQRFAAPLRELDAYEAGLRAIKQQHDELAVVAGAAQTDLALGWAQFKATAWDDITGGISGAASAFARMVAPGIVDGLEDMGSALKDMAYESERVRVNMLGFSFDLSQQEFEELRGKIAESNARLAEEEEERKRKAREDRKREAEQEARDEAAHLQKLGAARYNQLMEQIRKEGAAYEAARSARLRAEEAAEDRLNQLLIRKAEERLAALGDAEAEAREMTRLTADLVAQFVTDASAGMVAMVNAATEETIRSYEQRLSAGETFTAQEQAAYDKALQERRAAAIFDIVTQAAVAYAALVAQLTPALGPGSFIAAAGLVGAGLIAPLSAYLGEAVPGLPAVSGGEAEQEWRGWAVGQEPADESELSFWDKLYNTLFGRGGVDYDGDGRITDDERNADKGDFDSEGNYQGSRRSRGSSAVMVRLDTRTSQLRVVHEPPGKTTRGKR